MNTNELQQIKMAWLAAEEAGDKQAQFALLRDHPDAQDALIDFIAAYHITDPAGSEVALLPLTQRAYQSALERVFNDQATVARAANLRELTALLRSGEHQYSYGSCGVASTQHFAMEKYRYATKPRAQRLA